VRVVEGDARVVSADGRDGGERPLEAGHVGGGSAQLEVTAASTALGAREAAGAVLRVHVHI
jgi:hypothetical protein